MTYQDRWPWYEPAPRPSSGSTKPDLGTNPNPEVGRILGPKGQTMRIVRAKPDVPFGFRKGER